MARLRPPVWLTQPSRFAGLKKPRARTALMLLAAFLALCLTALLLPSQPGGSDRPTNGLPDIGLYEEIVAGVRGGGDYYGVAAQALRRSEYPLAPFVTFRLPMLAVVQASWPAPLSLLLLYGLVAGVAAAWFVRLRPAFQRPALTAIAVALLGCGLIAYIQPMLVSIHEIWAGLLVALALAVRRPGRWIEAVAIGLIAMLVRETAALFVVIMAGSAFMEGYRREATAWVAALSIFGVIMFLHAQAVAQVVGPLDPGSTGCTGMLGFGFFVKAMSTTTALSIFPAGAAALLVGLSLFGWACWRSPLAQRALLVFAAYAVLLSLVGDGDRLYWGLIVAPPLLIGLAFAPDGLRDLWAGALDSRRITVTRSVR